MRHTAKALILLAFGVSGSPAHSDEVPPPKHPVEYELTIAGISMGEADMVVEPFSLGLYAIDFDLSFRFLFWSGQASARTVGRVEGSDLRPRGYNATLEGMSKPVVIKTAFDAQRPTEWSITPPPEEKYLIDRIAIREAELIGALDPLTALVIQADTAVAACTRTVPVFTGGTRFDLVLTPGTETAPEVFGCSAQYVPVSGHRKDSDSVARMVEKGPDLSIFEVAPGLWVPHRIGMPTSVGTLAITRVVPEAAN